MLNDGLSEILGDDSPLNDDEYIPKHPPIDGVIPDVVATWGARTQVRWFQRFRTELGVHPPAEWDRYYVSSLSHRGLCCVSCAYDEEDGIDTVDACCCLAVS